MTKQKKDIRVIAASFGIIIICLTMLIIGGVYFYQYSRSNSTTTISDSNKFKDEYEAINGKTIEGTGQTFTNLTIPEKNPIVYTSIEKILEILEDGTGVIYFGFPECPWCRSALPTFLSAAEEAGVDKIYYLNALSIRDKKHLDSSGEIITTQEGSKEYYDLLDKLKDVLNPYDGLNDSNIKRLYFPTVLFVKDGKVLKMHESTVDSQTDPSVALTMEEIEELKDIYIEGMRKILMCDTAC